MFFFPYTIVHSTQGMGANHDRRLRNKVALIGDINAYYKFARIRLIDMCLFTSILIPFIFAVIFTML